jgi:hypothetical protein
MLWLKERASVEPPFVYDSGASEKRSSSPDDEGDQLPTQNLNQNQQRDQSNEMPSGSSGVERKGAKGAGRDHDKRVNKRDRNVARLSDILRANNAETNQVLREAEELKDKRHKELTSLRERELAVEENKLQLEERKLKILEKNTETAAPTGQGLIHALGGLASAVVALANK